MRVDCQSEYGEMLCGLTRVIIQKNGKRGGCWSESEKGRQGEKRKKRRGRWKTKKGRRFLPKNDGNERKRVGLSFDQEEWQKVEAKTPPIKWTSCHQLRIVAFLGVVITGKMILFGWGRSSVLLMGLVWLKMSSSSKRRIPCIVAGMGSTGVLWKGRLRILGRVGGSKRCAIREVDYLLRKKNDKKWRPNPPHQTGLITPTPNISIHWLVLRQTDG